MTEQNTELVQSPVTDTSLLLLDQAAMANMMKLADFMASAKSTVPQAYRNNPGDCLAVVMQATQWRMNPYTVAQKTHFINGNIGYEAQLVNAVISNSGAIKGQFHYEWFGEWTKVIGKFEIKTSTKDNKTSEYRVPGWNLKDEEGLGIKIWATLKGETEPRVLELLLAQARTRNSTLWADDPKQQIAYLAQKRWTRLYAPGVIMGVYTADELEDYQPQEIDVTSQSTEKKVDQFYSVEEFGEKKEAWKASYIKQNKPADRFIQFIESKGKLLTDAMKAEINAWKKPETSTVIEGEATVVGSSSGTDDFVNDMNAEEQKWSAK